MKRKLIYILFLLFVCHYVYGATQICQEDFESVTPGTIPQNNPTGSGQISQSGRPMYGQDSPADGDFLSSGGNPGQCARAYIQSEYISGNSYTEPKWYFNNTVGGGTELYVKFDLKIDSNLGATTANREVTDFKFVIITDESTASSSVTWKCYLQVNPTGSYSWYAWGGGEYYFANATTNNSNLQMWDDHAWHTYEIYIKLGTYITTGDKNDPNNDGIVRMWEDGTLMLEDSKVPMRAINDHYALNSVGFISHAFSLGAPVTPMDGNIYYDNLEVWDGMPNAYYMATNGSDSNDGSINSPWADLQTSWNKLSAGDTLYIRGGTYSGQKASIATTPTGTQANPITIKAYTGETPVFDGLSGTGTFLLLYGLDWTIIDGLSIKSYSGHGFWIGYLGYGSDYSKNVTVRNCTIRDMGDDFSQDQPIYVSYGTENITIHNNLIIGDGDGFGVQQYHSPATDGLFIYNNIIAGCYGGMYIGPYCRNVEIYNNVIYNSVAHYLRIQDDVSNITVKNNIIYGAGTTNAIVVESGVTNLVTDNNLYWPNAVDSDDDGANSISGDPLFVDASNEDWHLQSGSPAIDAGISTGAPSFDLDGNARPQGAAYDIGAYEYVGGTPDTEAPSAISNLSGVANSESQITLSWTQATDNINVVQNKIYRDTQTNLIKTISATTSNAITGLLEGTSYDFWVSAVDGTGNEGAKTGTTTATLADTTAPTISSTTATSYTTVEVKFSEAISVATANDDTNYAINGGISVSAASLKADLKTVTLTVSTLTEDQEYTLTVNNIQDRATTPNTIAVDSTDTFTWDFNPVAWFKFNEGSGQVPADSIGTTTATLGVDASVSSDDPTWVDGKIGKALQFDGADDVVKLTNAYELNNLSNFTIMAWIYPISFGENGYGRLISKEASEVDDLYFIINETSGNNLGIELFNTADMSFVTQSETDSITLDNWQHVAVMYDDTGSRIPQFFFNGNPLLYLTSNAVTGTLKLTSNSFYIGNSITKNYTFNGIIDDVRIFDSAIGTSTIQSIYNEAAIDYNFLKRIMNTFKRKKQ